MKIQVLFFGITTDLTGVQNSTLILDEGLTIAGLKSVLKQKYPNLKKLDSYAFAVNEEYVSYDIFLKENDVVAVIPPVSGG